MAASGSPQSAERSLQDIRDRILGVDGSDGGGLPAAPIHAEWTASAVSTLNGSDQTAFAANVNRRAILLQNNSGNDIWWRFGGAATAAAPSVKLPAGWTVVFEPPGIVPTSALHVIGTNLGVFTALEA